MIKLIFFLIIYFNPVPSFAKNSYPTETDLKAAYCIPILQNAIESMTKFEHYPNLKNFSDKYKANLERVQFYLIPRIDFIDPTAVMAATKSAELDIEERKRISKFCSAKFSNLDDKDKKKLKELLKCNDSEASEIIIREEKCFQGNFLPY